MELSILAAEFVGTFNVTTLTVMEPCTITELIMTRVAAPHHVVRTVSRGGCAFELVFSLGGIEAGGLIQDLDADRGTELYKDNLISWQNQIVGSGDNVTSNRAFAVRHADALNGHDFLRFDGSRLVGTNTTAFDALNNGAGATFFAVIRPATDANPDIKVCLLLLLAGFFWLAHQTIAE